MQVDNPDHLYLAGEAMVPTHNSTLALDFLRSCSIHHGLTGAMFSLEMSKNEIVMRLLSAEAKVKLADMRAGSMSDDDWTRLARRMGEISEAPLFIDDSPNLTMMEIRAKARRLKQRHDLKMVVVDYMQLMTSGKKVESRQQEVSEFSRSLKLLAKELEVPVIAISQLNRGPEQRTDKRPQVSDLRESGCLPASTRILRADTGAQVTLGELMESGEQPLVWSLDERMRMVARPMVKVFPSGRKEVFRLRLASGRIVEATGNHPFMTVDGWIALEDLKVGDRVVVIERTNIRDLTTPDAIGGPVDLVVADLSFISLATVLPALTTCASPDADIVPMVKPQLEVGKGLVGAGGVVSDPQLRASAVLGVAARARELNWETVGVIASPLPGPSGNVEYFLWLRARCDAPLRDEQLADAVRRAVEEGPQ